MLNDLKICCFLCDYSRIKKHSSYFFIIVTAHFFKLILYFLCDFRIFFSLIFLVILKFSATEWNTEVELSLIRLHVIL